MSIRVSPRTSANINGDLIAMGVLGIFDNLVIHWVIGLHRAIETSDYALHAEILLILISAVLLAIGLIRERSERQVNAINATGNEAARQ